MRYDQDVEYVHQARVAIRRARAAARIYQDYFNPKAVKGYLKHLRRTARLLGAVRDMDVAIARLEDYQHKTRKHSAGDLQVTLAEWRAKRAAAHHALVAWLDSTKSVSYTHLDVYKRQEHWSTPVPDGGQACANGCRSTVLSLAGAVRRGSPR